MTPVPTGPYAALCGLIDDPILLHQPLRWGLLACVAGRSVISSPGDAEGWLLMELQLSEEELKVLRDVLNTARGNLRLEVEKTSTRKYKELLQRREAVLVSLIERIDEER